MDFKSIRIVSLLLSFFAFVHLLLLELPLVSFRENVVDLVILFISFFYKSNKNLELFRRKSYYSSLLLLFLNELKKAFVLLDVS